MIVNVKKCNGEEIEYLSDLGFLDLTALMGYLFAVNVIEDWRVEECNTGDIQRPRDKRLYSIEKKFIKNEEVIRDTTVNI